MKRVIVLFSVLLFLSLLNISINAQEEDEADAEDILALQENVISEEEDGGTSPDSIFWGLDRAIERIDLALTLNKAEKAKKGLEHARERLLETRAMIKLNRLDKAEKAKERHKEILERVKLRVREIESEDPDEELEEKLEIEGELAEHEEDVEKVETEIEVKIKGKLTDEQQAAIDKIVESFKGRVEELEIEIEVEQGKTKTKIKAKTGKDEYEIEKEIKERRKALGVEEAKKLTAEKAIERAEKVIEIVEDRIEKVEEGNITGNKTKDLDLAKELVEKANILLEEAKKDYEGENYTKAIVHANKAKALILRYVHARIVFDKKERERAEEKLADVIEKLKERKDKIEKAENKMEDVIKRLEGVKEKIEDRKEEIAEDKGDNDLDEEEIAKNNSNSSNSY